MRLLLATPCQLVIQDSESQLGHSLIAVFHNVGIRVPPENEVPSNALLPKEWAVFSKWAMSPEEATKQYSLHFEAYWPDGTLLVSQDVISRPIVGKDIAFIIRNSGFPIGQNGIVRIVLSLFGDGALVHDPVSLEVEVTLTRDLVEP
jgi:hypothetical protein